MQPRLKNTLIGTTLGAYLAGSLVVSGCEEPAPEPPVTTTITTMEYANQNIPSLASHFSGFGSLDKPTEIYINEAKYILTNANYASPIVKERVVEDTKNKIIDSSEVTGIQDLDGDLKNNRIEIANSTNIVDPYNKLSPVLESIAIIGNPVYPKLATNEELSKNFNLQNYSNAIKHLDYTPYIINHPEVFEAFNRKIIREDFIWYVVLKQEDNKELWTNPEWGRIANWNYHWLATSQAGNRVNRVTLMPWYDSTKMKEWYPDRSEDEVKELSKLYPEHPELAVKEIDRYRRLDEMWIPYPFLLFDWTNGGRIVAVSEDREKSIEFLKNNLSNLEHWYNRIITAYNNPDSEEHKGARKLLDSITDDRGVHGWKNTSEQFRKVEEKFKEDESLKPLMFSYGYMHWLHSWLGPPEIDKIWGREVYSIYGASLVAKALGTSVDFFNGLPFDDKKLVEVAYPTPTYLRDKLEANPGKYGNFHVGVGSSIGILSPIEGKNNDNAKELKQLIDGRYIILWSAKK